MGASGDREEQASNMSESPMITPPPCRDVRLVAPELASMARTTVRLHPRRGLVPELGVSKFGGQFLWPSEEKWPVCQTHQTPFVGVLQLGETDVSEVGFRPGTNLFQLLWCPRDHEPDYIPKHLMFWRDSKDIRSPLMAIPQPVLRKEDTDRDGGWYSPNSCKLYPERLVEFPDFDELPPAIQRQLSDWDFSRDSDMKERFEEYLSYGDAPGQWLYKFELSATPGTKVGGYARWIQYPDIPKCKCGTVMDHLLTVSTLEPLGDQRWGPVGDYGHKDTQPTDGEEILEMRHVTGLEIGDGGDIYYFICRSCTEWPTTAVSQCG
jgi:hypothetical protein